MMPEHGARSAIGLAASAFVLGCGAASTPDRPGTGGTTSAGAGGSGGRGATSRLMLVIDNCRSMSHPAPGAQNEETKWEVTRDALLQAIRGVPPNAGLPAGMEVGFLCYPNQVTLANDQGASLNRDAP